MQIPPVIIVSFVIVPAAIAATLEAGRRAGARRALLHPDAAEGLGALEGAVYGLMGLLIAFTFSGAATRFDARRDLITTETNAIGTAYLRIALLPPGAQGRLRRDFGRYVDARLATYANVLDTVATRAAQDRATALQDAIWNDAVTASKSTPSPAVMSLVLPPINDMIDITTTRSVALATHPPPSVFALLGLAIAASALFAGYGMGLKQSRSWIHIAGFSLVTTVSLFVIVDMEYPRVGFVRIDAADRIMRELRATMPG